MAKGPQVTESDEPFPEKGRRRSLDIDSYRETAAKVVRLGFILFAVVLALAAFLVAVRDNVSTTNPLVKFIMNFANAIDGPFSRDNGIFKFTGKAAVTKDAVVNWGIAAIVYLIISNVLQRLLRPSVAKPSVRR